MSNSNKITYITKGNQKRNLVKELVSKRMNLEEVETKIQENEIKNEENLYESDNVNYQIINFRWK